MKAGVRFIELKTFRDHRGSFFKPFARSQLENALGHGFDPKEVFFSTSGRGVLRGFHFQVPPADHNKIVFCLSGRILDIVVDLRKDAGGYGRVEAFELDASSGGIIHIPTGFGHAILSLENDTTVGYLVDSEHDPARDRGILWSSVDFVWPVEKPVISERDEKFQTLAEFQSPF